MAKPAKKTVSQPGRPNADNTPLMLDLLVAQFRLGRGTRNSFNRAIRELGSEARADRLNMTRKALRERLRKAIWEADLERILPLAMEQAEREGVTIPAEIHADLDLLQRNRREHIAQLEQNPAEALRGLPPRVDAERLRRMLSFSESMDDILDQGTGISVVSRAYEAARAVARQALQEWRNNSATP